MISTVASLICQIPKDVFFEMDAEMENFNNK